MPPVGVVEDELNVDVLEYATELAEVLSFEIVPNFRSVGPRLGEAVKELRGALAEALERIAPERPKAVAVDLVLAEASDAADDDRLEIAANEEKSARTSNCSTRSTPSLPRLTPSWRRPSRVRAANTTFFPRSTTRLSDFWPGGSPPVSDLRPPPRWRASPLASICKGFSRRFRKQAPR